MGHTHDVTARFEPPRAGSKAAKQVIAYVVAYSPDGSARDVTTRYLSKRALPGKTKGLRLPPSSVPAHRGISDDGTLPATVVAHHTVDWFANVLRPLLKPQEQWAAADWAEHAQLHPAPPHDTASGSETEAATKARPTSIAAYKNHPTYILRRHLKRDEAILSDRIPVRVFASTANGKRTTQQQQEEVFLRADVRLCKSAETWYRQGRYIRAGEQPLKLVKRRAVTLARKRQIVQDQLLAGGDAMQGLYAPEQTEPYVPPPVEDGHIPTNAYGRLDVFVPAMVPHGAVHMRLPAGVAGLARTLGIDYADAVTGFAFRQQRAVPVVDGIVVASENEGLVRDAWRAAERERRRLADARREGAALAAWRRFVLKARLLQRVRRRLANSSSSSSSSSAREAGGGRGEANPFVRRPRQQPSEPASGFIPPGLGQDWDQEQEQDCESEAGGFLLHDQHSVCVDDDDDDDAPGPTGSARRAVSLQIGRASCRERVCNGV